MLLLGSEIAIEPPTEQHPPPEHGVSEGQDPDKKKNSSTINHAEGPAPREADSIARKPVVGRQTSLSCWTFT